MPPKDQPPPEANARDAVSKRLKQALIAGEKSRLSNDRTPIRRLTRIEYENTLRDLFDMPGLQLRDLLPADGKAHGFDNNSEALSISHVNLAKYIESADHVLEHAIATQPDPPSRETRRCWMLKNTSSCSG